MNFLENASGGTPLLFRIFTQPLQAPSAVRYKSWAMQEWIYEGDRRPFAPDPLHVHYVPGVRVREATPERVVVRIPRNIVATAWMAPPRVESALAPFLADYQQDGFSFLSSLHSGYLALPVGTGKTRVLAALCAANDKDAGDDRFHLIVAPKSLAGEWRSELVRLGLLFEGPDLRWTELRSRKKDEAYDLAKYGLLGSAKWVFIHPEILASWKGMLVGRVKTLIIDEAHRDYRATESYRTQALAAIAANNEHIRLGVRREDQWQGARVYASSGTPFLNRPTDAYPILNILEPGSFGARSDFRIRYCGATLGYQLEDGEPTHLDELRDRFKTFGFFRSRKEIGLQLPPLYWSTITCDASKRLQDATFDFLGTSPETVVEMLLEGRNLSDSTLGYLVRLAQIASADKIPSVVEHVKGLVEQGERVLVFCRFRQTVEALFEKIRPHAVTVATYGGGHESDSGNAVAQFRALDGRVLISTYEVLGAGVNLQEVGHVIHHDLSWEPAVHVQGTARAWRRGRTDRVCAYLAFAQHSIDEILARALVRKYAMISSLDVAHDVEDYRGLQELGATTSKEDVASWVASIVKGAYG